MITNKIFDPAPDQSVVIQQMAKNENIKHNNNLQAFLEDIKLH